MNHTTVDTATTDRASVVASPTGTAGAAVHVRLAGPSAYVAAFASGASAEPGKQANAMARIDTKVWPLGPPELASG